MEFLVIAVVVVGCLHLISFFIIIFIDEILKQSLNEVFKIKLTEEKVPNV